MDELYEKCKSFEDMKLSTNLLRGIFTNGWEFPSEIQQKVIVPILSRNDTIAQAQSGTGKTGAFTISALQNIDWSLKQVQVIIVSPTRELATQTCATASSLGKFLFTETGTRCSSLVGGTSISHDIQSL